ncbi:hypothetical protein Bbelb_163900 [Branchiostoma belcheri]|nr:hypothetical protein Bbelb_163900 [Branchiostoma belcheri]
MSSYWLGGSCDLNGHRCPVFASTACGLIPDSSRRGQNDHGKPGSPVLGTASGEAVPGAVLLVAGSHLYVPEVDLATLLKVLYSLYWDTGSVLESDCTRTWGIGNKLPPLPVGGYEGGVPNERLRPLTGAYADCPLHYCRSLRHSSGSTEQSVWE